MTELAAEEDEEDLEATEVARAEDAAFCLGEKEKVTTRLLSRKKVSYVPVFLLICLERCVLYPTTTRTLA